MNVKTKLKIILAAVGSFLLFLLGILAGKRSPLDFGNGDNNEGGIAGAINREGELTDRTGRLQNEISAELRAEENRQRELQQEISRVRDANKDDADRIRDTDSLVERLKKRNNLE